MILSEMVNQINQSGKKYVIAITGGGIESCGDLLRFGGGSVACIEIIIPYSVESLKSFLRYSPNKYCSEETARKLALRSFQRALRLGVSPDNAVGFGITVVLARDNETLRDDGSKRQHSLYIGYQDKTTTRIHSFNLTDSGLCRVDEEAEATGLILQTMHQSLLHPICDNKFHKNIGWNHKSHGNESEPPYSVQLLMCEKLNVAQSLGNKRGTLEPLETDPRSISKLIYSGSFNPIHEGHLKIARLGMEKTGEKPTFEISIENPDKPPLDYIDIEERFARISAECHCAKPPLPYENIIFTRLPLFKQKMEAFPSHTFIMGADTAIRWCDEKYGNAFENLEVLDKTGCRVIITERVGYSCLPLSSVITNWDYFNRTKRSIRNKIEFVPESEYKDCGISSSKIREKIQ